MLKVAVVGLLFPFMMSSATPAALSLDDVAKIQKMCEEGCTILSQKSMEEIDRKINIQLQKAKEEGLQSCKRYKST